MSPECQYHQKRCYAIHLIQIGYILHTKPAMLTIYDHTDQIDCNNRHGTKGYISSCRNNCNKCCKTDQYDPYIRSTDDQTCCRCYSFSAFEFQIEWIIMSQDRSHSGIHGKQRHHICMCLSIDQMYDNHCRYAFKAVSKQCNRSCFPAHGTKCIRCSCIPAPFFSKVNAILFSIYVSGLYQTKHISDKYTYQPFHDY